MPLKHGFSSINCKNLRKLNFMGSGNRFQVEMNVFDFPILNQMYQKMKWSVLPRSAYFQPSFGQVLDHLVLYYNYSPRGTNLKSNLNFFPDPLKFWEFFSGFRMPPNKLILYINFCYVSSSSKNNFPISRKIGLCRKRREILQAQK